MRQIRFLTFAPRRLAVRVGGRRVGSLQHDVGDEIAEPLANNRLGFHSPAIFDRVVQERGDRDVLRSAEIERQTGDAEQMRQIRNAPDFAQLFAVKFGSERERLVKTLAQRPGPKIFANFSRHFLFSFFKRSTEKF